MVKVRCRWGVGKEGNDAEQFKLPGKQVVVYPEELKSGKLIYPYCAARKDMRRPNPSRRCERRASFRHCDGRPTSQLSGGLS
jgi:hypothetical protein